MWKLQFGATVENDGVRFRVWAPRLKSVSIVIQEPRRIIPMRLEGADEFAAFVPRLAAGADYTLLTDAGVERPDPVSRLQPFGVHGPSRVVDPSAFHWTDQRWKGLPLKDYLIYELHTGTFTADGTFESIIPKLRYLCDMGVTAIEIMPIAEFPGRRNWGYDGVAPYAPQSSYGGSNGLKKLIDACHGTGLAVVLDVVYNHLGPEGNYLAEFAPYVTEHYRTPWGGAINYDGPDSDGVRQYFINNALYWLTEYHVDALRLDAIHGIFDFGARHVLQELADAFHHEAADAGRLAWLIPESDLNDVQVIRPSSEGGYGLDAQWSDDYHHSLYTVLTGDRHGYFVDFGDFRDLAKSLTEGFVYDGKRSVYRRRRHGSSSKDRPGQQFVVFTQNHDQIANALGGKRLSRLISPEQQKLAAAALLCSPFIPLLFMGQEYGELAPFHYFTDHGDEALAEAVREGRRRETGALTPGGEFVDPQDANTFQACKLDWCLAEKTPHVGILRFYRDLIKARKQHPCLSNCRKDLTKVVQDGEKRWLIIDRSDLSRDRALIICNFASVRQSIPVPTGADAWSLSFWSGAPDYSSPPENPPADRIGTSAACTTVDLAATGAAIYFRA
jgi:maltooligosyltrehalose trehalohydrolase